MATPEFDDIGMSKDFFTFSDLSGDGDLDVDLIVDQYLMNQMFYMGNKNRYPFMSFLQSVENAISTSGTGKKIFWLYGDEEPTNFTTTDIYDVHGGTAADIVVPAQGNVGTFVITGRYDYLQEGNVFHINGTNSNGTAYANRAFAALRINGDGAEYSSGDDETTINFTTEYYYDGEGQTNDTIDLDTVNITANLNTWDGGMPPGTQREPSSMFNYIQHQRETVVTGKFQMAEELLSNADLMRQAVWKIDNMLVKSNKHLHTQRWKGVQQYNDLDGNTSRDAGVAAGAPHFLCPDLSTNPTAANVSDGIAAKAGIKGTNMVSGNASITYEELKQASTYIGQYGSDVKLVFGSPSKINELLYDLETGTGTRIMTDKYTFPGTESVWELKQFEMGGTKWVFMPDYTMADISQTVYGFDPLAPSDNYYAVNTKSYVLIVDESVIGNRYLETEDGKQSLRMEPRSSQTVNGSTYNKMEIGKADCLIINVPQACGYLAWGGTKDE